MDTSLIWKPDTCHCIVSVPRPSLTGSFQKRCRIHRRSTSTIEVYNFNKDNRILANELTTVRISDPEFPQSLIDKFKHFFPFMENPSSDLSITRPTEAGIERKRLLKESTR